MLNLIKKTLRSYSTREEYISAVFIVLIVISVIGLISPFRSSVDEIPKENNVYSEGVIGKINLLNPVYTEFNSVDRDISGLIFSGLSKYDPVQKKVVEDIATHTLSSDKITYSFTIKKNAKWHDGMPVTADDVYFTYHDIIQNPDFENPILKGNFHGVEIRKKTNSNVIFRIREPNSFFFSLTTVGLLPSHLLKGTPIGELKNHPFNQKPVGTGPFEITESVKSNDPNNQEVTLRRYENYYGTIPSIGYIRFQTFPVTSELLKNKEMFHGISGLNETEINDEIKNDQRFTIQSYSLPQLTGVFINTDDAILKDRRVRIALLKSIDKELLIRLLGSKRRIDTPLLDLRQSDWLLTRNLDEAMGSLFDAGWKLPQKEGQKEKNQTRQNKKGEKLTLSIIALKSKNKQGEQEQTITLNFLQETWKSIGIDTNITILDTIEEFEQKLIKKEYQLLLHGEHLGYNFDVYTYWHSSQAGNSGLNLSNYRNVKADSLIESMRVTYDFQEKNEKHAQLGKIMAEDIPVIVLYTPVYFYAIDLKIENVQIGEPAFASDRLTSIVNWTIR